MQLVQGDHVCAVYSNTHELAEVVSAYLADGLHRGERCWYLPHGEEDASAVERALRTRSIDVAKDSRRGALNIVSSNTAYAVHGGFVPEQTMRVFSDAIEQALADGFTGFRAAAEMSWVLSCNDGGETLITYEALLRSLFQTSRVIGLCLYPRDRMPFDVIDGALATHPIVCADGAHYVRNPFYDVTVNSLPLADEVTVEGKLEKLRRTHGR